MDYSSLITKFDLSLRNVSFTKKINLIKVKTYNQVSM